MGRQPTSQFARQFGQHVGRAIGDRRRSQEMSGAELSVKCGLSLDAIRSIETGRVSSPGLLAMSQIAAVLNLSLDDVTHEARTAALAAAPDPHALEDGDG